MDTYTSDTRTLLLYVDKDVDRFIKNYVDKKGTLGLNFPAFERIDLFIYAMALGVEEGRRTPLEKGKMSLIRDTSVKGENRSIIFSLLTSELIRTNEEDKIDNIELAYRIAEEYANTGFHAMMKWEKEGKDNDTVMYEMMDRLNMKSDEIFGEEYR